MPFHQLQYIQYTHHGLAFVLQFFWLTIQIMFQFMIAQCEFPVATLAIMLIARTSHIYIL